MTSIERNIPKLKILLVGDSGVGKTSICRSYKDGVPSTEEPYSTVGVDFVETTVQIPESNGQQVKLQIWDTAGSERFRSITTSLYRNTHGVVFVYDITNRQSYFHMQQHWTTEFEAYCNNETCAVRLVVGNKLDDAAGKREILGSTAQRWANAHGAFHIECSAKNMTAIDMVFDYLADEIFKKPDLWKPQNMMISRKTISISNEQPNRRKCVPNCY